MQATVMIAGRSVALTFSNAVVYSSGDFAGNIDLNVDLPDGVDRDAVIQGLKSRVPGLATSSDVIGSTERLGGLDLTFYHAELRALTAAPPTITMTWAPSGATLGELPCRLA